MAKQKYYVVWKGRETGVFNSWDECQEQIKGFHKAVYKSFKSKELAEEAFKCPSGDYIGKDFSKKVLTKEELAKIGEPILNSICVDGAWNTKTGVVEYKGVYTDTETVLFQEGPFEDGTNNIVEFLALVHALAYCKKHRMTLPIYSDSKIAISWVKAKQSRTNHARSEKNKKLFALIDRAVNWLQENTYENEILKWETKAWGEIPADFGRK